MQRLLQNLLKASTRAEKLLQEESITRVEKLREKQALEKKESMRRARENKIKYEVKFQIDCIGFNSYAVQIFQ